MTIRDIDYTFGDMHFTRATSLTGFASLAENLGLDAPQLMQQAGLPVSALNPEFADLLLPIAGLEKLYTLVEQNTDACCVAARLGSEQEMSTLLGVVGFAMQQAGTIGDALLDLRRYFAFQVHGAYVQIAVNADQAALSFIYQESYRLASTRHSVEFALSAAVAIMKSLCGSQWQPSFTQFMHNAPRRADELESYFCKSIYFGQSQNSIVFPASDLEHEIDSANPELNKILHAYLAHLESEFSEDPISQVEKLIQQALESGRCDVNKVANFMGIHRRTLHRLLREHGTTFSALLERVRKEQADKMLTQTNIDVALIADMLCYTDPSSFSRAFKRWFAMTPQSYRQAAAG